MFLESNYSIAKRVINSLKDARDSVYSMLGKETPDNGIRYFERALGTRQADVDTGTRYAKDSTRMITSDMSDTERAEILKYKTLEAPVYNGEADNAIEANKAKLQEKKLSTIKKVLEKIGKDFKVYHNYNITDVDFNVYLSKGTVRETAQKQIIDIKNIVKFFAVSDEVISNAVGIEEHKNRYYADTDTKYMCELLSGFVEGKTFVPIRIGLKESVSGSVSMYVIFDDEKINLTKVETNEQKKQGSKGQPPADKSGTSDPRLVNISVAQIIKNVNNKNFVKYFPTDMLSDSQQKIKESAVKETQQSTDKTNDIDYEMFIKEGKQTVAKEMLKRRATEKGYSKDADYRISHTAPNSKYGTPFYQMDKAFGNEVYSEKNLRKAAYLFGDGADFDQKAITAIRKAENKPEALVTIYRAVSKDVKDTRVRNGDWVTTVKEYAIEHGERQFDDNYRIIENKVPAKYLWGNGDSINEYGYDNGNTNEVYKNTPNSVKTLDITYDDNGKVIPISKRFDESVADKRYSKDTLTEEETEALNEKNSQLFDLLTGVS